MSDNILVPDGTGRPRRQRRGVGLVDVARAAGVSHTTVSRVLNGSMRVAPATRQQVEVALQELGYRPNLVARALVSGRSRRLAAIAFDTNLFGPASTLFAIEQAARRADYSLSIAILDSLNPPSIVEGVRRLVSQAVEGVIIIAPHVSAPHALRTVPPDLPAVVVGRAGPPSLSSVSMEQTAAARAATEHLLRLGHRTVWHVCGPGEWTDSRGRKEGWRQALREADAPQPPLIAGDWSARSGYAAGRRLVAARKRNRLPMTAVFVANDHMALGVIRALREADLHVPGDVSLVGFDDVPEAPYFPSPLTTVRQDFSLAGTRSLQLLLNRIAGSPTRVTTVLESQLIIRASTAPPAH